VYGFGLKVFAFWLDHRISHELALRLRLHLFQVQLILSAAAIVLHIVVPFLHSFTWYAKMYFPTLRDSYRVLNIIIRLF